MRVALLIGPDGAVSSVSGEAYQLDPRLKEGVKLDTLEVLRDVQAVVEHARQRGHADQSMSFGPQTLQLRANVLGAHTVVTISSRLGAPSGLPRVSVDLVDALLSGEPLPSVLTELCRAAESSLPDTVCEVQLLGEEGLLHHGAGPNAPAELRELSVNASPRADVGIVGEAVHSRQLTLVSDMLSDARYERHRAAVERSGRRSAWAWPILPRAGEALGALVAYGARPGLPSDAAIAQTFALVRFAALAIEHARNERVTREMLERYHLVAQASTNVIYDWNLRSNTLEWSPRMRQVFGYADTQPMSFDWWESCLHPAERDRIVDALEQAIIDRRPTWSENYRFRRQDGTWATVIDRGHLLFDDNGAPTRLIGEMSDVSGQQTLQARLALTERLASVGTLAAGVAHEINNPLAWISSNLQFALEELSRLRARTSIASLDEVLEALNDAKTGAVRVTTIVRDLKLFARAQDEQVGLVDVRRVLESAITMARNEIRHRAQLERRFDDVPMVRGNEGKLSQVFLNLLINAAHAVPEGDVTHHSIVVTTGVDENGSVVVSVRDTGHGIEPDLLPHIFDPFFTTKPVGQGTGLGLSICHSIVSGHGGTIQVESTPNGGATFKVTLPQAPPEFRKSPLPMLEKAPAMRGVVVLIDDEPSVLAALQRVLGRQHEVKTFTDPQAALEALGQLEPDVIFCDVMMPHMSGAELYTRLRGQRPALAERLIFMTGGAFSSTAREFLDDAQRPVLDKPFAAEAVRRLVNEQVARVHATR